MHACTYINLRVNLTKEVAYFHKKKKHMSLIKEIEEDTKKNKRTTYDK